MTQIILDSQHNEQVETTNSEFENIDEQIQQDVGDEQPIIWPEMTEFEKEIIIEWGSNENTMNLCTLIEILHKKMHETAGFSFYDKLKNMDFTIQNGKLDSNIMIKILAVSYCRHLDFKNGIETETTPKLVECWNEFKSHYLNM